MDKERKETQQEECEHRITLSDAQGIRCMHCGKRISWAQPPHIEITPADRAAVEAAGETQENVFGVSKVLDRLTQETAKRQMAELELAEARMRIKELRASADEAQAARLQAVKELAEANRKLEEMAAFINKVATWNFS